MCVCVLVILAYESIVLCKCSGKYIDIYFNMKITFHKSLYAYMGKLECSSMWVYKTGLLSYSMPGTLV